jgi:signal transduction histidine kinase
MEFVAELATFAHELRTPLSSLGVAFGLIRDRESIKAILETPEQYRRLLDNMARGLGRLDTMVSEVLEMGYLHRGTISLALETRRSRELLAEALEEVTPMAARRRCTIHMEVAGVAPDAVCDSARARQVIVALLSFAIRNTPVGGGVRLGVAPDDQEGEFVRFAVEDGGEQLAPEHQARMFELFFRVSEDTGEGIIGTGFSMAIAKALVELHGGRIWVRAIPGGGNSLEFTLPRARPATSTES